MRTVKVLLFDLAPESDLAGALTNALGTASEPRVEPVAVAGRSQVRGDDLSALVESHQAKAVFFVLPDPPLAPWEGELTLEQATPVFAITEADDPKDLLGLLHRGFTSFVRPPLSPGEVLPRMWRSIEQLRPERRTRERELVERVGIQRLIGRSPAFLRETRKIPLVARCDASVLISGETGTGKELVARAIHYLSPRSNGPFVPVNCGAIPDDLVENELFGHERGAYTGAIGARSGLVEGADGGTLLLDEIDCLPPLAQVKILRFLQEKEFRRLGSSRLRKSDVRAVAATNANVEETVERGKLRKDLYYRLNVIPISLPPLRERREDLEALANHFLRRESARLSRAIEGFTDGAMEALVNHDWPGNVRELEHVVQRAFVLSGSRAHIRRGDTLLPVTNNRSAPQSFKEAKAQVIARFERGYVERMLAAHSGNITRAARAARKNRRAFWELVRKHGIDVRRFKAT